MVLQITSPHLKNLWDLQWEEGAKVLLNLLLNLRLLFVIFGKILRFEFYSGREFGTASLEIHLKSCK